MTFFLKQFQAGIHDSFVVKGPSIFLDLLQSGINPQSGTIGAVGSHGLDHIGYGQDTGIQEDFFPFQPLGIHPFMVLQDYLGGGSFGVPVYLRILPDADFIGFPDRPENSSSENVDQKRKRYRP